MSRGFEVLTFGYGNLKGQFGSSWGLRTSANLSPVPSSPAAQQPGPLSLASNGGIGLGIPSLLLRGGVYVCEHGCLMGSAGGALETSSLL